MSSQQSSNSSLENHRSQLELHHKCALIELTLLSLPCTLPLHHFFSEDQTALSLITTYHSADMAMSYVQTISSPAEEANKPSIIYHMTKIKLVLADRLLDRGFEQALTLSMISEISESRHLLSVEPLHYPSQETLRSPSESSNKSTPVPIPTISQLAIRTAGNPRHTQGKARNIVTFGVGLSRPITPSSAPFVEEEDTKPNIPSSTSNS
ncbi:hypothetical protein BDR05DRAFT_1002789 [Suillus weaverae]|nr:hypothetical protein BDR05DRAFT_1002789 [Suillus weaverae]